MPNTSPDQPIEEEAVPALDADELAAADEIGELLKSREESLRLLAEMDNLRKRAAREVEVARKFAAERLLEDLLPVIDSLERGVSTSDADPAKVREGLRLTLSMLRNALIKHGMKEVDPAGSNFDPELHQAMSTIAAGELGAGKVAQVYQKGYTLNDRLVRPALVVVTEG